MWKMNFKPAVYIHLSDISTSDVKSNQTSIVSGQLGSLRLVLYAKSLINDQKNLSVIHLLMSSKSDV